MILLLILLAGAQSAGAQSEQCGLCHPVERVEHSLSIHSQEFIQCSDCHGGRPDAINEEQAHGGDFRSLQSRKQIPRLCARCHADPTQMRAYNLPTDQYALYQTSGHGLALAEGNESVAVCTDCHGTHTILRSEDPNSPTFIRNIPETCGQCHGKGGLQADAGTEANQLQDYLESVHARELLEKGNTNAPECSRCHGIHGAAPAGVGDVGKMCGNCHSAALQAFRESPHASSMVEAGLPECLACHAHHKTQPSQYQQMAQACLNCHAQGSDQYVIGEKMEVLFARAEEELEHAREVIARAERVPLYVEDYLARLEEARTFLLEAEPAVHTVSFSDVDRFTSLSRSLAEEIEAEIDGELSDLRLRRLLLVVFWFYLLLTVWILHHYRQKALKHRA